MKQNQNPKVIAHHKALTQPGIIHCFTLSSWTRGSFGWQVFSNVAYMYTIRYTFLFTSLHFCFSIAGGIEMSAYHDIKLRARGHNSEVFTKSHFMNCPTLFLPICLFIPPSVQNRRGNNTTAPLNWMESLQTQGEIFKRSSYMVFLTQCAWERS